MEQKSSISKIVSLHLEKCKRGCPHSDICYLRKRVVGTGYPLPLNFREDMLEQGYTIHEAMCTPLTSSDKDLLARYRNYNVTISYPVYIESNVEQSYSLGSQLQVSVYTEAQAVSVNKTVTKLFLIKDLATFRLACSLRNNNNIANLHFNIDMRISSNIQLLMLQNLQKNITLDSCMSSWIINGECPYTTNYIDISYDWTIRKCPFSTNGTPIPKNIINKKRNNYDDLFKIIHKPAVCCYEKRILGDRKQDGR